MIHVVPLVTFSYSNITTSLTFMTVQGCYNNVLKALLQPGNSYVVTL